jgi:acetylglutamate kinase
LHGGKGVGLSGKDSRLIEADKKAPHVIVNNDTGEERMVDLGLVGEIKSINPDIIDVLTQNDYVPIISPIGVDNKGEALNLNADTVAGDIASKIDSEKLIILTDVPGILEDPTDPDSLLRKIKVDEIGDLIKNGVITEGMLPKTLTCIKAIEDGVSSAHIIDGRIKHSILLEIFTKKGIGTMITS